MDSVSDDQGFLREPVTTFGKEVAPEADYPHARLPVQHLVVWAMAILAIALAFLGPVSYSVARFDKLERRVEALEQQPAPNAQPIEVRHVDGQPVSHP